MSWKRAAATALACTVVVSACSSNDPSTSPTTSSGEDVVSDEAFPEQRCAANEAAGTITYLSSFDFAAAASIVDVLVAKQKGYYDELCLDVDVKASFSTENYPLIAANDAQFSSAGSFSELVTFRTENGDADVVALSIEGKTAIDALIVKQGEATQLADLAGKTIGVKGKITASVQAMLAKAGLIEGQDYQTVPMEGFDPTVHIALPNIVAFPGYKSNEPGQLERAGIPFTLFDPAADDIPGSFGLIYTNREFMNDHPDAVQDFMRATMQGLADAVANPSAASMIALDFIDNNGNPNFLSPDGETFRWETESKLIADTTPVGEPLAMPDGEMLQAEIDAYAQIGLYGDATPDVEAAFDRAPLEAIYDTDGVVIWPTG